MTATLDITLPPSVHLSESELKMILAAKLFDLGELSSGQAAKMVGISRREFLENVGQYGVSVFGYDADDLEDDLRNLSNNLSIEERLAIVEDLAGIAESQEASPRTEEEWREERTEYLIEKYR